ncbi:MAG: universal stress protein [Candidatus Solibacter sp.]
MFPLTKILLPIDFSERCLGGARYAIPLAEHFRSELTLLHVISPVDYLSPEVREFNATQRQNAQKQLDDFLCTAFNHLDVRRILREGDPAEVIADQAGQDKPDLIMLPTHGYTPFRRLLLGSVTSKVLNDTACAVWTGAHVAKGPPAEWIKLAHIVCAVDLGPHSVSVLRWAAGLAAEFKSRITLLHVVPRLDSPGEAYYAQEWRSELLSDTSAAIAAVQQKAGTDVETVLEAGEVSQAVSAAAARLGADLVVIGRGDCDNARLRTHAFGIIRESPCPVVSV